MELAGKDILILGLGDTGLSAARYASRRGARVRLADSRDNPPNLQQAREAGIEVRTGPFSAIDLLGVDLLVISPGLSLEEPIVERARGAGIEVVGDVELFAREIAKWNPAVIAITGSNGKSTVTTMVGQMCIAAGAETVVAGNIGLPVLDTLDARAQIYVLELSSFQLETLRSLRPAAATVLNVTEDHLDRYRTMDDYAATKARVFQGGAAQILNRDDAYSMAMRLEGRKLLTFGLDAPKSDAEYGLVEDAEGIWLCRGARKLLNSSELKVAGLHNAANALAALALCNELGLAEERLLSALREFTGLPHRVEKVAEIRGVAFYDDSKGTNVGATVAALQGLSGKAVLILGGEGKGQDFSPLEDPVSKHARAVVLIGRDAGIIWDAIKNSGVRILHGDTMDEAVRIAFSEALPGDSVLLSPACASFDMFRNYAHRAQCFIAAVRQLEGGACITG